MPVNVVDSKRDEEKWEKATEIAKKSGQGKNYAYIMGIYKKMKPDHSFKKVAYIGFRSEMAAIARTLNNEKIGTMNLSEKDKNTNGLIKEALQKMADDDSFSFLNTLPAAGGISGGLVGYRNPHLFDPKSLFPSFKAPPSSKHAKLLSGLLGASTMASAMSLPAIMSTGLKEVGKIGGRSNDSKEYAPHNKFRKQQVI